MRAPTTSARAYPKVFLLHLRGDILQVERFVFNILTLQPPASPHTHVGDDESDDVAEHVEAVRHQGHGVGEVANYKLHNHV